MLLLGAAVLGTVLSAGRLDTTLTVKPGARLEVSNFEGSVAVSAWERDAVRVQAEFGSPRARAELQTSGGGIKVSSTGERGLPGSVDYRIMTPAWMALDIEGPFTDVDIDGSKSDIKVETVRGDVTVSGGSGNLELSTVQGDLAVEGAKGRIKLSATNEGVTASHIAGQCSIETVSGDIILDDVQLDALDATSVSGDMWFRGGFKPDGRYQLQTHNGDIDVVAADHPNAVFSVSTFSGDFSSDFDVTFTGTKGHREMEFTLGDGGPRLSMESFSGDIRLLKASMVEALQARLKARNLERGSRAPEARPKNPKTPKPPKPAKAPKPDSKPED